jgi:phage tail tape-measure protein
MSCNGCADRGKACAMSDLIDTPEHVGQTSGAITGFIFGAKAGTAVVPVAGTFVGGIIGAVIGLGLGGELGKGLAYGGQAIVRGTTNRGNGDPAPTKLATTKS